MRASLPAYPLARPPTGRPASVPHSGAHPRSCPPGGSQSPQSQSGASPKPGGTGRRCTGLLARGVGGRQTVSQLECLSSSGMQGSSRQGAQRQPRKPAGKPAGKPASKPASQPASKPASQPARQRASRAAQQWHKRSTAPRQKQTAPAHRSSPVRPGGRWGACLSGQQG